MSTSSQTLLERVVTDPPYEVKELLWLGMEPASDSMRAAAHVQRMSDAQRTVAGQLSPVAQRVVDRINRECAMPRAAPGTP